MDHFPSRWGKPRNENVDAYNTVPLHKSLPDSLSQSAYGPVSHTQLLLVNRDRQPLVTGTSVIALKYRDGVMMAADMLGSYGSLARFRDIERLYPVGDYTIVGCSGDISDYQYIQHLLDTLMIKEHCHDDGHVLGTSNIFEYLWRVMYNRRSKFNPLWNALVVGGVDKGERFLGYVDLRGTTYQTTTIATGFGAHLAQPILRKRVEGREDDLTEEEAIEIINDCMKVLFYRDARSMNKFQRAKITASGVEVTEPYSVETEWGFAEKIRGYGA
ncbi:proteasome endopeptidase complex beta subunit [Lichtheimia corymbifera JMRC:FSU:9682]|uniref:Proteasome subunit beta n=1 Tax=Lichtheimia corymbifera JMRC:FSU:9682 TaxID=1263082 RepID=A0A068RPY8_9FUNG|nr:proteasome endopeptidase complex beta subunit [Lichtheimia corymbifera JMRC:FSU:9682]